MKQRRSALLPVTVLALGLGIPLGRAEAAQQIKVTMPFVALAMSPVYLAKGRGYFATTPSSRSSRAGRSHSSGGLASR